MIILSEFTSLGITELLVKKLKTFGITNATQIQEQTIPYIMDGKDVIAQAQTGTGKTFAFVLPILEKINTHAPHIQALIVTPTRELAIQITEEISKLIESNDEINVLSVYGGQDVEKQLNKLKKRISIVVGTPGRLLDHIRRGTICLSYTSFVVLDEADQMLHIGFLPDVEEILKETPSTRQTMLFSATIPEDIRKLAQKHMNKPVYIQVEKTQRPAKQINQIAIHTVDRAKQRTLIELINTYRPYLAVIFCRTKRRVSKLYEVLKTNGFLCAELHGDLSQAKREDVMKRFRDGEVQLLIATDVAARGIDVEGITHVFNYDIPQETDSYVHRIGRTGRAGMKGVAVTLYTSPDRPILDKIEKELNITIQKKNVERKKETKNTKEDSQQQRKNKQKQNSNREQNAEITTENKKRERIKGTGKKYKKDASFSVKKKNQSSNSKKESSSSSRPSNNKKKTRMGKTKQKG